MFKICTAIMFVCISMAIGGGAGCSTQKYHGILYYGSAQRLYSLDLDTGMKTILYVNPNRIIVTVTKLDGYKFIFGSNGIPTLNTKSGRITEKTGPQLQVFNRSNGEISSFHSQIMNPVYLAKLDVLVFEGVSNKYTFLYWATVDKPDQWHLLSDKPVNVIYPLVPVSNDEVAYYDGNKARLANIKTGKLSNLNIPDCIPYLWRERTHQLLCSSGDSFNYFLINLNGTGRQILNIGENHVPLYYIDQLDIGVFNGVRLSLSGGIHEVGTLWFYDFGTHAMTKISDDAAVGVNGVIWYPYN